MKNDNIIKIGCKHTQLFQRCPECDTLIRIPKKRKEFIGTPYYYWKLADSLECPTCYRDFKFTRVKVTIPDERKRIKTKNDCLLAFDIGMPLDGYGEIEDFKSGKYEKQYSCVAIFESGVQFLEEIYSDRWSTPSNSFLDGSCYVYTDIDFDGNVECGVL